MPQRLAITAPNTVQVIPYDDPPLKSNQVLVRTQIASGKHGTMLAGFHKLNLRGQRYDPNMRLFVDSPDEPQKPWQPSGTGTMGVGIVTDVGPDVTRWKIGDRVFGPMDVRQTNICPQDQLWALDQLDPHQALCVEPAYVAFHCIRESQVRYGDTVAIVGLGALGLLAVQMAATAAAHMVFAVDTLEKRRDWAARNGADHVLDPRDGDAALKIHELTGGKGVDVAIELAGTYPALATAVRATRMCGTVCSAGFYQGESQGLWLGREWHQNRLNIVVPHGCGWGHVPRDYPRWDSTRAYDTIVAMMRKGKLSAAGIIDPVVTLQEGPEVWRLIANDPAKVIKYAVQFD
jgi:threonine dehydrogenase-like Zn-dependent dehydrogenase